MKVNKKILIKITILFLSFVAAIFLRFYKLGEIPNGLYIDEAAIGYNAYSFLKTGLDEYGKAFPIFLRSYEAYAPPLYTYVSVLPISFIGLTVFATRLISALSGVLIVILAYLILKKLDLSKYDYFSEIGALIISLSPWTIFFSRGTYEANLSFLIILIAIYLLLLARNKKILLIPAFVLLSLSAYAYQAERVISYLIIASYFLVYFRDKLIKTILSKEAIISLFIFIIIQLPQLSLSFSPAFRLRATGLFYKDLVVSQSEKIFLPRVLSYPLSLTREFSSNLISYFSPKNLFWIGDSDLQRSFPGIGPFYFWLVVPYIVGLWIIVKRFKEKDFQFILFLALSFALVPALTKDPFSTLRSLPLSFPLSVVISLGLVYLIDKYRKLWFILIIPFSVLSIILFWRSCFVLLPHERARIWGYGIDKLVLEIQKRPNTKFVLDQSRQKPLYVSLAFFLKYPPEELQKTVDQSIKDNYYSNTKFDSYYKFANIETRSIKWEDDIYKDQMLVGDEFSVSPGQAKEHFLTQEFEILGPTGEIVFRGYKTSPDLKCLATNFESIYCKKK